MIDDFTIAFNHGFKAGEIAKVRSILLQRRAEITGRWLEHGRNAG